MVVKMQDTQADTNRTDGTGGGDFITGTLGDWFNLSAQLGNSDRESLALEACLHGLAQQAGQSFLHDGHNGIVLDWPDELVPDADLLAHALKFSVSVSSPYTAALLELAGFTDSSDKETRKSWSWRQYSFTMDALAGMKGGQRQQAFDLGKAYIGDGGKDERIVVKYAQLLFNDGDEASAKQIAEDWIKNNKEVDTPQLITFLLDKFTFPPDRVIGLATRAIAGLAVDQPTASLGNLVLQRGFAYDRLAHQAAVSGESSGVCASVKKALADFQTAGNLPINPLQTASIRQRRTILTALASEHGCDNAGDPPASGDDDDDGGSKEAAMRLLLAMRNGSPGSDLLETVTGILKNEDKTTAKALYTLIRHIADDDDAPDDLRASARFIKDNISVSDG